MGALLSGLSLLMALALAAGLLALAPRDPTRIRFRRQSRAIAPAGRSITPLGRRWGRTYSTLGYAFNLTLGAAGALIAGLLGFHLDRQRSASGSRWSEDIIWWQIWMGLALACVAVWFWRKGLREIRSGVLIPEVLDGERDERLPPSRRMR